MNPKSDPKIRIDRRTLLVGGGVGAGLLLAWRFWPRRQSLNLAVREGETALGAYLKIGADNRVTVAVPQAEMGQGIWTALPQIVADALGADWKMIGVEPAPIGPAYANHLLLEELERQALPSWAGPAGRFFASWPEGAGSLQATVGSNSIPAFHDSYMRAGEVARALLCKAAAKRWETDWRTLQTRGGFVINGAERLAFGALAAEAAGFDPPDELPARDDAAPRLAGRSVPRLDAPPKLDGSARFGADVRLPNMLYASVRSGPFGDSTVESADVDAGGALKGVVKTIRKERWVAALGESWWVANRALNVMKPTFSTRGDLRQSAAIREALSKALRDGDAAEAVNRGDAEAALGGKDVVTAEFSVPMLAHASPETPNATARISGGRCEIWTATQSAARVRNAVADALGFSPEMVAVYPTLVGGGFGRMIDPEPAVQAALLAQEVKRPVQLVWSRYQDTVHDAMRPPMMARLRGALTPDKTIGALEIAIAAPDSAAARARALLPGLSVSDSANPGAIAGAVPPYDVPVLKVTHRLAKTGGTAALWRSGPHSAMAFFIESFVDELAAAAGLDPLSFRLRMLKSNPRHAEALKTAASVGGYAPFAGETAQGIAVHETDGAVVALLAEVSITKDQGVKVNRVVAAVDCGRVINPDLVRQQIEGGIVFALNGVIRGDVNWNRGLPEQIGMGQLGLPLLPDAPEIEVQLIPSDAPPAGVSAAAIPVVAPAVVNAVYAATGKRIHHLPLTGQALS